jgi:acylphosphatase
VLGNKLLYKILITGRVQGVGFRWNVSTEARNRGINDFIKNLSNGTVYLEAEGYKEQLDDFVEWCRNGPGLSIVESLKTDIFPPVGYKDFRIEH